MTDMDEVAEEPAAEESGNDKEPLFWATFSREDARLLVMTFAGTLGANVVTVAVVAIALLSRGLIRSARTPSFIFFAVGIVAEIVWLTAVIRRKAWRDVRSGRPSKRLTATVYLGSYSLLILLTLMVLLGYAAGVK